MNPILAKIRALRELSRNNSNPNEAANAAAAAERLCQENRISEATLDASAPSSGPVEAEVDQFARIEPWRSYLLTDLAKHHGCAVVYLYTPKRGYEAVCYGAETDVEVVREMYSWLTAEVEKMAEAMPPRQQRSFKVGASEGIRDAMQEAHDRAQRGAPSTALAVLDARLQAAEEEKQRRHKRIREKPSKAPRVEPKAFRAGHEAGRKLTERAGRDRRAALK